MVRSVGLEGANGITGAAAAFASAACSRARSSRRRRRSSICCCRWSSALPIALVRLRSLGMLRLGRGPAVGYGLLDREVDGDGGDDALLLLVSEVEAAPTNVDRGPEVPLRGLVNGREALRLEK